jgi:hypothetical protein
MGGGGHYMHGGGPGDSPVGMQMSQLLNSMPMGGHHAGDQVSMEMQGPPPHGLMHGGPGQDMDSDQGHNYGDYSPMSIHKQVEVY